MFTGVNCIRHNINKRIISVCEDPNFKGKSSGKIIRQTLYKQMDRTNRQRVDRQSFNYNRDCLIQSKANINNHF